MSQSISAYRTTPVVVLRPTPGPPHNAGVDRLLLRKLAHAAALLRAGECAAAHLMLTHVLDLLDANDAANSALYAVAARLMRYARADERAAWADRAAWEAHPALVTGAPDARP